MRSGWIYTSIFFLFLAHVQPALSDRIDQDDGMRILVGFVEEYHSEHGEYPVTDAQSTWYEKAVSTHNLFVPWKYYFRVTEDGCAPLDYYGHPFVYEPPDQTNSHQIVIRAVGRNGEDDQGALDDWDLRFGPNWGYWYKTNWPAITRRVCLCLVLVIAGLVWAVLKIKGLTPKLVFITAWAGFLAFAVLPLGLNWGNTDIHAGIFPRWIGTSLIIGLLLLLSCIPLMMLHVVCSAWHRRSLRPSGTLLCAKCHYDLRGSLSANIGRCPECGEPVPEDTDIDVDLTPPPSP
jgi:hypothetical protein